MSIDRAMTKVSASPFFWWSSGFAGGVVGTALAWWSS